MPVKSDKGDKVARALAVQPDGRPGDDLRPIQSLGRPSNNRDEYVSDGETRRSHVWCGTGAQIHMRYRLCADGREAREAKNRAMNASVASKKSVSHARLKALNVATRRKCRPETQCPERARVLAWRIRSRYWSLKNYYFCSHTAHVVCYFCYYQRIFDQ